MDKKTKKVIDSVVADIEEHFIEGNEMGGWDLNADHYETELLTRLLDKESKTYWGEKIFVNKLFDFSITRGKCDKCKEIQQYKGVFRKKVKNETNKRRRTSPNNAL